MKQQFGEMQVAPPDRVWERLEGNLNRGKKRKALLWRIVGSAAAVVTLFFGTYHILQDESVIINQEIAQQIEQQTIQTTDYSNNETTATNDIEKPILSEVNKDTHTHLETDQTFNTSVIASNSISIAPISSAKTRATKVQKNKTNTKYLSLEHNPSILESNELELLTPLKPGLRSETEYPALALISTSDNRSLDAFIIEQNILAQESNRDLELSPMIGTQYAMYNAMSTDQSPTLTQNKNNNFDISGGVSFTMNTNKRIGIQTGIYYSQMSQNGNFQSSDMLVYSSANKGNEMLMSTNQSTTTWGSVDVVSEQGKTEEADFYGGWDSEQAIRNEAPTNIRQTAAYLEVPLIVRYSLIQRKIGLDVLGGVHTNFLVNNQATLTQNDTKQSGQTNDLKSFSSNSVAGLSLYYHLTKQLNIGIEPKLKYYFNSLSNDNSIQFKPYVFGVYTGINYAF